MTTTPLFSFVVPLCAATTPRSQARLRPGYISLFLSLIWIAFVFDLENRCKSPRKSENRCKSADSVTVHPISLRKSHRPENRVKIGSVPSDSDLNRPIFRTMVTIMEKGAQMTLENNLPNLMISIDLSTNRFTGDIPETIGELKGIKSLNLSHNAFTGSIPNRLGHLMQIESLDLSWNKFSGEIPQELISLNFLSTLNLSFNHLVGRIPQSGQFLAFDNSSFEGNPGLCGAPLSKLCNVPRTGNNSTSPSTRPGKNMTTVVLLFLFIGLGFGTGFAIAIISTIIKRARNAHTTR